MPWPRALTAATFPLAAAAAVAGIAGIGVSASGEDTAWFGLGLLVCLPNLALGWVITRRHPRNPVGALLAATGLVALTVAGTDAYQTAVLGHPGMLPVNDVLVSLSVGAWIWLYVPVALLVLVFPGDQPARRRDKMVGAGILAAALAMTLLTAVDPAPYPEPLQDARHALGTAPQWVSPLGVGVAVVFLGLLAAAASSMVDRMRRAEGMRRNQLRWFALAGLTVPATLLLCWASYLLFQGPDLVLIGLVLIWVAIPAATGIAMLRHDLFDVDRAAVATLTYTVVSASLLAVFTAVSALGGVLLGRGSALTAAAATAICALALQPLRRVVHDRVESRIHPMRHGVLIALEDQRRRVHAGQDRPEQLESTLRTALRDPGLRVAYRLPGGGELVDGAGRVLPEGTGSAVPVVLGGTEIGAIVPGTRHSPSLLAAVAEASGLLVEVVRLRTELSRALDDVAASRTRILHAGYAERRRLERDLHDGAQQRLVSLGMALRLAQRHLDDGTTPPAQLDAVLDSAVAELATAVAELRQLAHGLRPSSLDDGLESALANLAHQVRAADLPIEVELDLGPGAGTDLADDVSTTAYFVASEAVANVVKHAGAERIAVSIARSDGSLQVRVRDNGRGGATLRPGSGLAGLRDRVAALGGSLAVASPASGGTVVEAVLPCAS